MSLLHSQSKTFIAGIILRESGRSRAGIRGKKTRCARLQSRRGRGKVNLKKKKGLKQLRKGLVEERKSEQIKSRLKILMRRQAFAEKKPNLR